MQLLFVSASLSGEGSPLRPKVDREERGALALRASGLASVLLRASGCALSLSWLYDHAAVRPLKNSNLAIWDHFVPYISTICMIILSSSAAASGSANMAFERMPGLKWFCHLRAHARWTLD
jgi:hypothetical protein